MEITLEWFYVVTGGGGMIKQSIGVDIQHFTNLRIS